MKNQPMCGVEAGALQKRRQRRFAYRLSHIQLMASSHTQTGRVPYHLSVEFQNKTIRRPRPIMAAKTTTEVYQEFESKDLTDEMLAEAAQLFSEHLWHVGHTRQPSGRQTRYTYPLGPLPLHCRL